MPVRSQGSPRAERSVTVTALLPELRTSVSLWLVMPAGTVANVVVGPGLMRRGMENGPVFVVPDRLTVAGALLLRWIRIAVEVVSAFGSVTMSGPLRFVDPATEMVEVAAPPAVHEAAEPLAALS